jgi:hypothetical protein
MIVTRASRRDRSDIEGFYAANSWELDVDLSEGIAFIARQGPIVGCIRLFEVASQKLVVEDVLVAELSECYGLHVSPLCGWVMCWWWSRAYRCRATTPRIRR